MIEPTVPQVATPDEQDLPYRLQLFVAGASVNSVRAITNLKQICEAHLAGQYSLEVVDVYQQKQHAELEQLVALPLLIKRRPLPERRMIGDLSDTARVLGGLGLTHLPA